MPMAQGEGVSEPHVKRYLHGRLTEGGRESVEFLRG